MRRLLRRLAIFLCASTLGHIASAAVSPIAPTTATVPQDAAATSAVEEFSQHLSQAQAAYAKVNDYVATMVLQERIGDVLRPREVGTFRFAKPYSVYLQWRQGPRASARVLYVEGKNGGRMLARPAGLLGVTSYRLDPKSSQAMKDCRHPITEAGIGRILDILETSRQRALAEKTAHVKRLGPLPARLQPPGERFELIVDAGETSGYYCRRAIVTFDPATHLVVAVQIFDWKNRLIEDYRFVDLQLNTGQTEEDFTPAKSGL